MAIEVKNLLASAGDIGPVGLIPRLGRSPGGGHGNPLSMLAWRISWTKEPCRLQSIVSQRVGHNWSDTTHSTMQVMGRSCRYRWSFSHLSIAQFLLCGLVPNRQWWLWPGDWGPLAYSMHRWKTSFQRHRWKFEDDWLENISSLSQDSCRTLLILMLTRPNEC